MLKSFNSLTDAVFEKNLWGDSESRSGPGSNLQNTVEIRNRIPELLKKYNIKSLIDAPCGDFNWMKEVSEILEDLLDKYLGIDIVDEVIKLNNITFATSKISFVNADLTKDILPQFDCVLCRDLFLHLSYMNIFRVIKNFKKSGIKYMLISTYTKPRENYNVLKFFINGRALNMQKYPFCFPNPIDIINEKYLGQNEEYNDKSLALWKLDSIKTWQMGLKILFGLPGFYAKLIAKKIINAKK